METVYFMSYEYKGDDFVEADGAGRRLFSLNGIKELTERRENAWLMVFGMMLIVASGCVFGYRRSYK